MRASHPIRPVFGGPNLVSAAGLVPVLRLAGTAGLDDLLNGLSIPPTTQAAAKAACVVGGMLAGADSIDDLGLLRHGGTGAGVHPGVRAPSTLGTFLRSFTHGHVQQLDTVNADLLGVRVPALLAGSGSEPIAFVDVDDTSREVHGYTEQAPPTGSLSSCLFVP